MKTVEELLIEADQLLQEKCPENKKAKNIHKEIEKKIGTIKDKND